MNELDEILLEQLHSTKRGKKKLKRIGKLLKNDPLILVGEEMIDKKIQYLESMIEDKTLLHKKEKKKKKNKDSDLFARHPVYEWYRTFLYMTVFSFKTLTDGIKEYKSLFKKGKD